MRFIGHIAHKLDIIVTRSQLIAMEIVKGFFFRGLFRTWESFILM